MKKFLAILMAICMMASMLCVSAFAADPVVLRVQALKSGEADPILIGDYTSFEDGWNDAMKIAGDKAAMRKADYDRIIVDLYTDWNADDEGGFTDDWSNGAGFDNDTIFIPKGAKVTLNLNGHTINRGLTKDINDGEVMFINDDADVIINDGTITGGYSNSEGGGLYIEGGATVTLNNVNVDGNAVVGDDGSGIYLYGGATLIMNGGSLSNNFLDEKWIFVDVIEPFGTLCAVNSTVILNDVIIDGNYTDSSQAVGALFHITGSTVKMNRCTVSNNVAKGAMPEDFFHVKDSSLTIADTDFTNNFTLALPSNAHIVPVRFFNLEDCDLSIAGGKFIGNGGGELFGLEDTKADIKGVTITDNAACVLYVDNGNEIVNLEECTLGNNKPQIDQAVIVIDEPNTVTMADCDLGDTTFTNREYIKITSSGVAREEAVIGIDVLRADGTSITGGYYKDFVSGWKFAMECAKDNAYDRIIIDLYADWTAPNGNFTDTAWWESDITGFKSNTIAISANAKVTLNLNGHTIDRAITYEDWNGEVIYIDQNANVIINDGTITGGGSKTGAGGIHIKDNAKVVLNNVNVVGNSVDGSNGAAIAVYDGAVLVMNGGCLSENVLNMGNDPITGIIPVYPYGTLYVEDATATLNNVTIDNNRAMNVEVEGVALYVNDSTVTLNNCIVSNNGTRENGKYAESIIGVEISIVEINNTDFIGNGAISDTDDIDYSRLFDLYGGILTMNGGKITGNAADKLFYFEQTLARLNALTITENDSVVFDVENGVDTVTLTKCILGNNSPIKYDEDIIIDTKGTFILKDCELGDTTFDDNDMVTYSDAAVGSIFGEGSLTMIFVFIAVIDSIVSIYMIVLYKKKKEASATVAAVDNEE